MMAESKRNKVTALFAVVLIVFTVVLSACSTTKTETPENVFWINGTHALLTKVNNGDLSLFGGMKHNATNKEVVLGALKDSWGVTNKAELTEMIDTLSQGRHNAELVQTAKELGISTMEKAVFDEEIKAVTNKEDVMYLQNIFDSYSQFGENAIMGWDLSRATQLCGYGYLSDLYTYEEATTKAFEIGKQIQATFGSWDDFFASYMQGYLYWSEDDKNDPKTDYAKRVTILSQLKNDPKSPLHLDWQLDLSNNTTVQK